MSHVRQRVHFALILLGCFSGGSLYGWSGYLPAVRAHFSLTNAAGSMVFSLALVSFTLGVLLGPALLAKISNRFRLPLLTGLATFSLGLAATSSEFTQFVILYGIGFGVTSGALYNHAISTAATTAAATVLVPLSVAAFGLGGAVFGPLHVWLTASGWALWSLAPALACLALTTLLALMVLPTPIGPAPTQTQPKALIKPDKTILTLGLIFAAGSCSGLIVLGLASQILPQGSISASLASLAIFCAALGNTLGRLSTALLTARFGPARTIAGALILSMATLCSLIFSTTPAVIVGVLFLVAFAYGLLAATMPLLVSTQVTAAAFSSAFGWVFIGWGIAGLAGPWAAGWVLDATGTVQMSLVACIALSALSLGLVLQFASAAQIAKDC